MKPSNTSTWSSSLTLKNWPLSFMLTFLNGLPENIEPSNKPCNTFLWTNYMCCLTKMYGHTCQLFGFDLNCSDFWNSDICDFYLENRLEVTDLVKFYVQEPIFHSSLNVKIQNQEYIGIWRQCVFMYADCMCSDTVCSMLTGTSVPAEVSMNARAHTHGVQISDFHMLAGMQLH